MATQEQLTHIKDVFMRLGDALNLKDSVHSIDRFFKLDRIPPFVSFGLGLGLRA